MRANVPTEVEVHMQVIRADGSKGPEVTIRSRPGRWRRLLALLKR